MDFKSDKFTLDVCIIFTQLFFLHVRVYLIRNNETNNDINVIATNTFYYLVIRSIIGQR